MPVSSDFLAYVIEQFAPFTKVTSRRMFGGVGLYAEDLFFALIDDDTLYLKAGDGNREDYIARGCKAFRPFADDPTYSMNYFELPADVLEDPDVLREWARRSLEIAASAAAAKRQRKSRKSARQTRRNTAKGRVSKR